MLAAMTNLSISDDELLRKFAKDGFNLPANELDRLRHYLDDRAVDSGLAAPMHVREMIQTVQELFRNHDPYGGIRIGFIRQLNELIQKYIPDIQLGDPLQSAKRARELRDKVISRVRDYDPRQTYE
jgi:hypothetical protein